jgi:acyl dehydratase
MDRPEDYAERAEATLRKTGFRFAIGTDEEGRSWIGRQTPVYSGDLRVELGTIHQYCSAIEDPNPSFWDEAFAERVWDGIIAPSAMMMVWTMQLRWKPGSVTPLPPLMGQVPVPGDTAINVSSDTEYFVPVRPGDKITLTEELTGLSESQRTRVGVGNFVTTVSTYRNQHGVVVATQTNTLLRFRAEGSNE